MARPPAGLLCTEQAGGGYSGPRQPVLAAAFTLPWSRLPRPGVDPILCPLRIPAGAGEPSASERVSSSSGHLAPNAA